jgi:hypothetical protein
MNKLTEIAAELLESVPNYELLIKAQQQLQTKLDLC